VAHVGIEFAAVWIYAPLRPAVLEGGLAAARLRVLLRSSFEDFDAMGLSIILWFRARIWGPGCRRSSAPCGMRVFGPLVERPLSYMTLNVGMCRRDALVTMGCCRASRFGDCWPLFLVGARARFVQRVAVGDVLPRAGVAGDVVVFDGIQSVTLDDPRSRR